MTIHTVQSVFLGALLHDVGKLLHKASGVTLKHPEASLKFVQSDDFPEAFRNPIVETLAEKHHENPNFPHHLQVQSIEDKGLKTLALLCSEADNLSSSERAKGDRQEPSYYKEVPLNSIFQFLNLGMGEVSGKWVYQSHPYHPSGIFPVEEARFDKTQIGRLINAFRDEFRNLRTCTDFHAFFTSLYHLLMRYAWCVPSDVTLERRDVSLFDHLKTTAAIAGCMYLYHEETNSFSEEAIKDDKKEKFLLVSGDLSGIQNYIFALASPHTSKVAKRLRARSFFIQMVTQAAILALTKELKLEVCCILMAGGGNFHILAPNTDTARERVGRVHHALNSWLLWKYHGSLVLNVSMTPFAGEDFSDFSRVLEKARSGLSARKSEPLKELLLSSDRWNEEMLVHRLTEGYKPCKICHREAAGDENGEEPCETCQGDEKTGRILASGLKYLTFYLGTEESPGAALFVKNLRLSVVLHLERDDASGCFIRYRINPEMEEKLVSNPSLPTGFFYLTLHIPRFPKDPSSICSDCRFGDNCDLLKEEEKPEPFQPMSFLCIGSQSDGAPYMACIKGDVDRLGLLFSEGLGKEYRSVSRLAAMSRMLEAFFGGFLQLVLEKSVKNKYQFDDFYTVYSGGDDFLFFAPWSRAEEFLTLLRERLREFACGNPNITFSAGVAVIKPALPVASAVHTAEEALEKSKKEGRNALTIFSQRLTWEEYGVFKKLLDRFSDFRNADDKKERLPQSFLYRLLRYAERIRHFRDDGRVDALSALAVFNYDIRRNIYSEKDAMRQEFYYYLCREFFSREALDIRNSKSWEFLPLVVTRLILEGRL